VTDWREVWRLGIAPELSLDCLWALERGLDTDDPELIQGGIVLPVQMDWGDLPVEASCPIGYAGWKGNAIVTVEGVETFFKRVIDGANRRMADPQAAYWFATWVDDTPRADMRRELLAEVRLAIAGRLAL
jgi:hypothetical protein